MLREMADVIDTIIMYAGDPIRPSNTRVFTITPEIYEWIVAHSTKTKNFLDSWKKKIYAPMPPALPEGESHEVPTQPAGDDLRRVP